MNPSENEAPNEAQTGEILIDNQTIENASGAGPGDTEATGNAAKPERRKIPLESRVRRLEFILERILVESAGSVHSSIAPEECAALLEALRT